MRSSGYLSYEIKSDSESLIEDVKINVSCSIDTDITPSVPVNTVGYEAKLIDANGDGLQDIYIQKKVDGRHQDFYLKQKVGAKFDLVTNPTSQQAALATSAEQTDIIVIRADFNDDIGITEGDASLGAGEYAIPSDCDPRTPGQKTSPNGNGDSRRLRDNLIKSKCGCEETVSRNAAHHIIPKKSKYAVGQTLKKCLTDKRNIDIDSAINGVCLPNEPDSETNAFPHMGSEGNLHGPARLQELLELCESAQYSNREFEDLLRTIADGYTKGIILP